MLTLELNHNKERGKKKKEKKKEDTSLSAFQNILFQIPIIFGGFRIFVSFH